MISILNNHPTIRCFLLYYVVIYENPGFKWKCMCTKQGRTQLFWKGGVKKSDLFNFFLPFLIFLPFLPQNSTFLKTRRINFRIFLPLLFCGPKRGGVGATTHPPWVRPCKSSTHIKTAQNPTIGIPTIPVYVHCTAQRADFNWPE